MIMSDPRLDFAKLRQAQFPDDPQAFDRALNHWDAATQYSLRAATPASGDVSVYLAILAAAFSAALADPEALGIDDRFSPLPCRWYHATARRPVNKQRTARIVAGARAAKTT
jgi:hypothetical protein